MPKVSVVIPAYNHAAYIKEAVDSVLAQTYSDLELIVIDDGSHDNSLEILAGYRDSRLKVIAQHNQGAHAAINRGLRIATGEFLSILNSDDVYHPQRLEKLIAALQLKSNVALAGSFVEIINERGQTLGVKHGYKDCPPWPLEHENRSFRAENDLRAALLTENYYVTTSNFIFPRWAFEKVGELLPLRYTHDWDFALRLSQVGQLLLCPEPLMRYRVHGRNTIRENQAAMIFEICWILAVHLPQQLVQPWFSDNAAFQPVQKLLNSLYVYGCERVFGVLTAYHLSQNALLARQLLDSRNPLRQQMVMFIQERLARHPQLTPTLLDKIRYRLVRFKNSLSHD